MKTINLGEKNDRVLYMGTERMGDNRFLYICPKNDAEYAVHYDSGIYCIPLDKIENDVRWQAEQEIGYRNNDGSMVEF